VVGDCAVTGLVSTVIPVRNRAALLSEAVRSVVAQTHRPIEIVIVDDGSSDDTPTVAKDLAREWPDIVRVLSEPPRGPGAARESGRQAARGEFICYLDSDDLLAPRAFECHLLAFDARGDCGISYGLTRHYSAEGRPLSAAPHVNIPELRAIFPAFLSGRAWRTGAQLYRATLSHRAGAWLPIIQDEDWEYDCRMGWLGTRLAFVPEVVLTVRDVAPDRLSAGALFDASRLGASAQARAAIFEHAQNAGFDWRAADMQRFSRSTFLLARRCGAAGLGEESRQMHDVARRAAGPIGRLDLVVYGWASRLFGWQLTGRVACALDSLRAAQGHA
jgi:hypothetical protein